MLSSSITLDPAKQPVLDDSLVEAVQNQLGILPTDECSWEPVAQGGSDREFYRLSLPSGSTVIIMHYSAEREENALYPEIASFLFENNNYL